MNLQCVGNDGGKRPLQLRKGRRRFQDFGLRPNWHIHDACNPSWTREGGIDTANSFVQAAPVVVFVFVKIRARKKALWGALAPTKLDARDLLTGIWQMPERIVMIEKYAFQMTACDTYYANVLLNKWVLQPHKTIIDLHLSGVSMRHVALCECIMYCNVKSSSYPVRHMASNHSLERC